MEGDIICPACDSATEHTVLHAGRDLVVRCEVCGTVHSVAPHPHVRMTPLKVIVSSGPNSRVYRVSVPRNDMLSVGSEIVVDDGRSDVVVAEVTAIETDKRVSHALARDVKCVWSRAVDDVVVKISVYRAGRTRSFRIMTKGDEVFAVGDVREVEGLRYKIVKIKGRNGGFPESSEARDIIRVWGRQL
ncbi:MAG: hypothetical protein H5T42_06280 [Methanothrix sp.]|uniref:Archaeal Zn-finger protein n=1 Tax=Methanothrix thermoacetophila (strain DSM 6194 / JCM 14653 / NBRC 101360 / PT) TaxID=349307 RepID=A0B9U0_METTP|nr:MULTISPECIES: HVO_0476 family zinc finger protein [Methanothrix]ABK15464.1 conserved hypothetical protein [Methanothrix thermoacetophila PT]MBC7080058.1 hypothetical protein [Methanothrix sp.]NPU88208.1 hypothetical protein [Methanothrix sp.]